jgi:hypothetical protein
MPANVLADAGFLVALLDWRDGHLTAVPTINAEISVGRENLAA